MPTIQIKYSTVSGHAPSSLLDGQLAINIADSKLFWADSGNVVRSFSLLAPTAPTLAESDDSSSVATTAFVQGWVATLLGGAPSNLNSLSDLAAAINDDPNFYQTLNGILVNMIRFDQTQVLNAAQQNQLYANIGLGTATIDGGTF